MSGNEALEKLKNLFENQKKYETDVFVKIVTALSAEAGGEAYSFLGEFVTTSENTLLIPRIIEVLGKRGGDKAIPYIVNTMKEKSTPAICRETANALRTIGTKSAKEALELLYEIKLDPVMKELFKRKVDEIIKENPIEYVWMPKLLLGEKMASACIDAAKSLARIAKEKAIPHLLSEIFNRDLLIRTVIVTAIGDIGSDKTVEKLLEVFKVSYEEEGKKDNYIKVVEEIKELIPKSAAEERVFELINKNSPKEYVEGIKKLFSVYKEKISKKISVAANALFEAGLSGLAAHLVSILRYKPYEGEEAFKRAAGFAIKEIDIKAAEHNKIMSEVIISLGKILQKSKGKEEIIKNFLIAESEKLRDDELKARAIEILGEISGEDIVDKLVNFTQDKSWKIREKAVYSLGEIGNKRAIETLKKSCEDMHQNVSAAAMDSLGKIDQPTVIELFGSSNWRIRKLALQVARTFNDPSIIQAAKKLLDDEKYDVAFEAIEAIGSVESDESISILSALIKKDGAAKIQEKVLEKLESISNLAVLKNITDALEAQIPLTLFANVQKTLLNVITKVDSEIEYDCIKKIKDSCIDGMSKNDIKIKLNAISLASELRDLQTEDYNDIISHLKEYEKLRSSRNPQEKAIAMAADNSVSVLEKKVQDIHRLEESRNTIESLYDEVFDRNEMRSKNAIAEIWKRFSTSKLSTDTALRNEIWNRFSKRILMNETSPYIRSDIAKIFGEFKEPKAVPILLKFRNSKVHIERLAIEEALRKLTEQFTKEEIVSASSPGGAVAKTKPDLQATVQTADKEAVDTQAEKEDVAYKVLIVDDALLMRNLYSRMLTNNGYITDVAKDGVETFKKIRDNKYDIILLDLKLPDVGGLDILKKVPEITNNKNIKVIIVSSYIDDSNTKMALELGAAAVFAKPVDIDMLSSKIKIILR